MLELNGIEIVDVATGRLRLKVQQIKRNPLLALLVERELGNVPGITEVKATALTGSVLIHVDPLRLNTPQGMEALSHVLRSILREVSDEELAPWLDRLQGWLAASCA